MRNVQEEDLVLISHVLCPYVQRAVTTLEEAGLGYKRIDIDLNNKPAWFQKISPLGKVPVLVVNNDVVLFESAVISEYINDISRSTLLSDDPLQRAQQRAWIEFSSASLSNIVSIYNAKEELEFTQQIKALMSKFSLLEENIKSSGFFSNANLSLVDAAFAPIFRYLDLFEQLDNFKFMKKYPKIQKWRKLLSENLAIKQSVGKEYPELLYQFISRRDSFLGERASNFQIYDIDKTAMLSAN